MRLSRDGWFFNLSGYRPYNWDLKLARMAVLRGHNSCESIGGMQTYCNPWVFGIDVFLADHLQVPSIAPDPYISPCRSLIWSILIPVTASYTLEYIELPSTSGFNQIVPIRFEKSKSMKAAWLDSICHFDGPYSSGPTGSLQVPTIPGYSGYVCDSQAFQKHVNSQWKLHRYPPGIEHSYGTSQINEGVNHRTKWDKWAIFHSYVKLPEYSHDLFQCWESPSVYFWKTCEAWQARGKHPWRWHHPHLQNGTMPQGTGSQGSSWVKIWPQEVPSGYD